MYYHKCGQQIEDGITYCPQCGIQQNVGDVAPSARSKENNNPMALWGFICALVGLMLPLPIIDLLVSLAGTVMSVIGVQKSKMRGLAIAGIVIGIIGVLGAITLLATEPDFYFDAWDF